MTRKCVECENNGSKNTFEVKGKTEATRENMQQAFVRSNSFGTRNSCEGGDDEGKMKATGFWQREGERPKQQGG